jgi:uncharacterized membrane protein
MNRDLAWPAIIIVSSFGIGVSIWRDIESPIRPALTFWFLLVCPGMALVRLLQLKDFLIELTLAIALSIALGTLVSEAMLVTQHWSSQGALAVLIGVSLSGAVLQIYRSRRHP